MDKRIKEFANRIAEELWMWEAEVPYIELPVFQEEIDEDVTSITIDTEYMPLNIHFKIVENL